MAHAGSLGSETNPIPRSAFNRYALENFVELDGPFVKSAKKGVGGYAKVAPTLVLYPQDEELTAEGKPREDCADGGKTPA